VTILTSISANVDGPRDAG